MKATNVDKAVKQFLLHCQYEKKLSDKTLSAYTLDLSQFVSYLNECKLEGADKQVIKSYIKQLHSYKTRTLKRKIATLKAFFNYLEYEELIESTPFRKIKIKIKEPRDLPSVMTLGEIKLIFKTAYSELNSQKKGSIRYNEKLRDVAVLELLFASGVRVSELSELRPDTVDLKANYISVRGKGDKERVIQLTNREVIRILRKYFKLFASDIYASGYFFVNRRKQQLSTQSVRFMIKSLAKKAGIEKAITPHTFRHTFATLLLEQDVDIKYIQHLLGHSSIMTTQIYTHVNKKQQQKILRTKHPRRYFSSDDF